MIIILQIHNPNPNNRVAKYKILLNHFFITKRLVSFVV